MESPSLDRFVDEAGRRNENVGFDCLPEEEARTSHGAWTWNPTEKTHTIYVASGLPDDLRERVIRHECWHARETSREADLMARSAEFYRIPPAVFNLFEDARIEQAARDDEGEDFGHLTGPTLDIGCPLSELKPVTNPLSLFHLLHFCEGHEDLLDEAAGKWAGKPLTRWRGEVFDTVALIEYFLNEAQATGSTNGLWRPMLEWLEVFGGYYEKPPEMPQQNAPSPSILGKEVNIDGTGKKEKGKGSPGEEDKGEGKDEEEGASGVGYSDKEGKVKSPTKPKRGSPLVLGPSIQEKKLVPLSKFTRASVVWSRTPDPVACNRLKFDGVPQVEQIVRRFIGHTDFTRERTNSSGGNPHIPSLIGGLSDAFRRPVVRGGKRRLVVLMDMSGSMGHDFRYHGAQFLRAMHNVSRAGHIEARLFLTNNRGCCRIPDSITNEEWGLLMADGGHEGIQSSLNLIRGDLEWSETAIVYTDGDITDGDPDPDLWRSRGVNLLGAMVTGNIAELQKLLRHFGKGVIGESSMQLASACVAEVMRRS